MTKEEILNGMSEEEFYRLYPTREDWENSQQMKLGGLSGAPHNGQPTADQFFSYGSHMNDKLNIPMSNPFYLADGGTYYGGPIRPYDGGGNTASPTNYGAFNVPMEYGGYEEYGGVLDPSNNQDYPMLETGGRSTLQNIIKAASKKLKKEYGGDTVMQGGNSDNYPQNITNNFKNAIKRNMYNSMINEEEKAASEAVMQMGGYPGGMYYNQGPQLNPQNQMLQSMYQQRIDDTQANLRNDFGNFLGASNYLRYTANPYSKTTVKAKDGLDLSKYSDDEIKAFEEYFGKKTKGNNYYYGYDQGMNYFPMNYNPYGKISKKDVALMQQLAANPTTTLKEFSHRHFGPWGRTKMTFGYKDYNDQTPYTEYKGDPIQVDLKNKPVDNFNFQKEASLEQSGPRILNQDKEEDPMQGFIPKRIMLDNIFNNINNPKSSQQGPTSSMQDAMGNSVEAIDADVEQIKEQGIKPEYKKNNYGYTLDDYIKDKLRYEATSGSALGTGFSDFGYHATQIPSKKLTKDDIFTAPSIAKPIIDKKTKKIIGYDPTDQELQTALDLYKKEVIPQIDYFGDDPALVGRSADFLFNTGRDPRVYMMDQYLRSKGETGIPDRAAYNVDTKTDKWTPELERKMLDQWKQYQPEISKLPREKQIELLDQGRDWYYQNINRKNNQPSSAYEKTWKGRIEGDKKYKKYGGLFKAQYGRDHKSTNPADGLYDMNGNPVGINSPTGNMGLSSNPISMGNSFQPIGNAPGAAPLTTSYMGSNYGTFDGKPINVSQYQTPESVGLQQKNIEMKGGKWKEGTITTKQRPGFSGEAMANWGIAGINTLAGLLEQRQNAKNEEKLEEMQLADNAFVSTPGSALSQGDYDPNSGMFRPNQMVPVQFPGYSGYNPYTGFGAYGGSFQDGGMYEEGEELDLSPEEIEELRAQGYDIEYLD